MSSKILNSSFLAALVVFGWGLPAQTGSAATFASASSSSSSGSGSGGGGTGTALPKITWCEAQITKVRKVAGVWLVYANVIEYIDSLGNLYYINTPASLGSYNSAGSPWTDNAAQSQADAISDAIAANPFWYSNAKYSNDQNCVTSPPVSP